MTFKGGGPRVTFIFRFVFQTEISGKYIVLVLISLLFYFFSSLHRGDHSTVFCIVIKKKTILRAILVPNNFYARDH